MEDFKKRWGITKKWQLIHPFLGIVATLVSAYLIAKPIANKFTDYGTTAYGLVTIALIILLSFLIIRFSLWCFKKLENKWKVTSRWEYIAIFLCFAVTGSTAGRLSDPLMHFIGLSKDAVSGWLYWPVRILLIFPIYQVLLVIFGWCFGQYTFFLTFARKMLSRMGLKFLVKNL